MVRPANTEGCGGREEGPYESGRVVVPHSLGVAEGFEEGVQLEKLLL